MTLINSAIVMVKFLEESMSKEPHMMKLQTQNTLEFLSFQKILSLQMSGLSLKNKLNLRNSSNNNHARTATYDWISNFIWTFLDEVGSHFSMKISKKSFIHIHILYILINEFFVINHIYYFNNESKIMKIVANFMDFKQ